MALQDPRAGQGAGENVLPASPLTTGPLRDRLEFLRGFLRHPAQVGSVVPSSHRLEQRLVRSAAIRSFRFSGLLGSGWWLGKLPSTSLYSSITSQPSAR